MVGRFFVRSDSSMTRASARRRSYEVCRIRNWIPLTHVVGIVHASRRLEKRKNIVREGGVLFLILSKWSFRFVIRMPDDFHV